jgi:hypothetical protein
MNEVKYWLDRLSMMGKSAVIELHPRDTAKMHEAFSALALERDGLQEIFLDEVAARTALEVELAALKLIYDKLAAPPSKTKKKR